ncbi:hypothetical protein [Bartonella rattaustraliani]|uniref:hypothetical protein n=1 Tax=Bartonella rattaustraliani TaxID=481139 RepID=UPI0012EA6421|nr:hypothetical protein [Bartonella rattaustraliani]
MRKPILSFVRLSVENEGNGRPRRAVDLYEHRVRKEINAKFMQGLTNIVEGEIETKLQIVSRDVTTGFERIA